MKTKVIHNKLAIYSLAGNGESEGYVFMFDENDQENKTVRFGYSEEDAPQFDISKYTVLELLEEEVLFSGFY